MYIVQTAAANMPSSCKGHYIRVGVLRVVRTWEKRSVGRTERCASERAIEEAHRLADKLNREEAQRARRRDVYRYPHLYSRVAVEGVRAYERANAMLEEASK